MSQNETFQINFDLIGSASSLVSALRQGIAGLAQSGAAVPQISANIAQQMEKQIVGFEQSLTKKITGLEEERQRKLTEIRAAHQKKRQELESKFLAGNVSPTDLRNDPLIGSRINIPKGSKLTARQKEDMAFGALDKSLRESELGTMSEFSGKIKLVTDEIGKLKTELPGLQRELRDAVSASGKVLAGYPEDLRRSAHVHRMAGKDAAKKFLQGFQEQKAAHARNASVLKDQISDLLPELRSLRGRSRTGDLSDDEKVKLASLEARHALLKNIYRQEKQSLEVAKEGVVVGRVAYTQALDDDRLLKERSKKTQAQRDFEAEQRRQQRQADTEARRTARQATKDAEAAAAKEKREKPDRIIDNFSNLSSGKLAQIADKTRLAAAQQQQVIEDNYRKREAAEIKITELRKNGDAAGAAHEQQRLDALNRKISQFEQGVVRLRNAEGKARDVIGNREQQGLQIKSLDERGVKFGASALGLSPADARAKGKELVKVLSQIDVDIQAVKKNLLQAMKQKLPTTGLKDTINSLKEQKAEIKRQLTEISQLFSGGKGEGGGRGFFDRIKDLLGVGVGLGAIYGIVNGLKALAREAITTSAEFQRLSTSFVAVLAGPRVERGFKLTSENLQQLRIESGRIFEEAQLSAAQTVATTKEYVQILQTALAVGQSVGLNQQQIEVITKRLVLAAGAFGVELDKVGTSIGQLFTGTVRATNQLGRNLGIATTEQRKLLKEAIATGKLYEFLDSKTKAFDATAKEVSNNFINVMAAIQDIFQIGGTKAVQPFFKFLNEELVNFRDKFLGDSAADLFKPVLSKIIDQIQRFFAALIPNFRALFQEGIRLAEKFGSVLLSTDGVGAVKALIDLMTLFVRILGSILPLMTGVLGHAGGFFIKFGAGVLIVSVLLKTFGKIRLLLTGMVSDTYRWAAGMSAAALGAERFAAAQARAKAAGAIPMADKAGIAPNNRGEGFTAAGKGLLGVFSKTLGVVGLVITGISIVSELFDTLSGKAERERKHLEDQEKQLRALSDITDQQNKRRDLTAVANDYAQLAKQTEKTSEEQQRFAANLFILKQHLNEAGLEALRTGKNLREAFSQIDVGQKTVLDDLNKSIAKYKEFAGIIRSDSFNKAKEELDLARTGANNVNLGAPGDDKLRRDAADRVKKAVAEYERLKKVIAEVGPLFSVSTADIESHSEAVGNASKTIDDLIQKQEQEAFHLSVQVKTVPELVGWIASLTDEYNALTVQLQATNDETEKLTIQKQLEEIDRQRATLHGGLIDRLKREAEESGKTAVAYVTGMIARLDADIKRLESDGKLILSNRDAIQSDIERLEASAKVADQENRTADAVSARASAQALLGTFGDSVRAGSDALERQRQLEEQKRILENARQSLIVHKPKQEGKHSGSHSRDELNDFMTEVKRQLDALKKTGDLIEKELSRLVDLRKKSLKDLADTGAIPFQTALDLEEQYIQRSTLIARSVIDARLQFLAANERLAKAIATRQQNKRQVDKKGKVKPKTDFRNRVLEVDEKFADDSLQTYTDLIEQTRKAEQELADLVARGVKRRIDVRKGELNFIAEYAKRMSQAKVQLLDLKAEFGLISKEQVTRTKFEAGNEAREIERAQIIQKLFPMLDPKMKGELETAFKKFEKEFSGTSDKRLEDLRKRASSIFSTFFKEGGLVTTEQAGEFRQATGGVEGLLVSLFDSDFDGKRSSFAKFDKLVGEYRSKITELKKIDDELSKSKKVGSFRNKRRDEISSELIQLRANIAKLGESLGFSLEQSKAVAQVLEIIKATSTDINDAIEGAQKLASLDLDDAEARNQLAVELKKLSSEQLQMQGQLLDFDLQRLDAATAIVEKQKELGLLTEFDVRQHELATIDQQKQLLNAQKLVLLQRFATETANLKAAGGAGVAPDVAARQLELAGQVNGVTQHIYELNLRLKELNSPLLAFARGVRQVAEAVESIPDPEFDQATLKFKSLPFNKLAGMLRGVAALAEALFAINNKPKQSPEEMLMTGAEAIERAGSGFKLTLEDTARIYKESTQRGVEIASQAIVDGGKSFKQLVAEAGVDFKQKVEEALGKTPTTSQSPDGSNDSSTTPGDQTGNAAQGKVVVELVGSLISKAVQKAKQWLTGGSDAATTGLKTSVDRSKKTLLGKVAGYIQSALSAVASVISGLASGDKGQLVSGVGGAVKALQPIIGAISKTVGKAVPFIGAGLEVLGGVISFFGARARQKTHEMAEVIRKGTAELKQRISDGSIGLGEGLRELDKQLMDARRRLSGRKGGADELKSIEDDIKQEKDALRKQAKERQDAFEDSLKLLRADKGVRDTMSQIDDVMKKVKEYLSSFENPADLIEAQKNAVEYFQRVMGELKDEIEKNLKDLQTQLNEATESYLKSREDILDQGRVDPKVSEAFDKRRQLIELKRAFDKQQQDLNSAISGEQKKLAFVIDREKLEDRIRRYVTDSASALEKAANAMLQVAKVWENLHLGGLFNGIANKLIVDLQLNGQSTGQSVGVPLDQHLRSANRVPSSRRVLFNPVLGR